MGTLSNSVSCHCRLTAHLGTIAASNIRPLTSLRSVRGQQPTLSMGVGELSQTFGYYRFHCSSRYPPIVDSQFSVLQMPACASSCPMEPRTLSLAVRRQFPAHARVTKATLPRKPRSIVKRVKFLSGEVRHCHPRSPVSARSNVTVGERQPLRRIGKQRRRA